MTEKTGVCQGCASYKNFGAKCWYFWEHKRACTQFKTDDLSEPAYKELKE